MQMYSMEACWHSAGSAWTCTHGLSETGGSFTSFINLHTSLGLVVPELSTYDGPRSSRGRSQGRGRTETKKGRHLGVGRGVHQVEGSWPDPKGENLLLGSVFMAVNLM